MNLIVCNKDCTYQKDGYCCLEEPTHISSKVDGCCYYTKEENKKEPEKTGSLINL